MEEVSDDFFCMGRASSYAGEEVYGMKRGQGGVALFWKKNLAGVSRLDTIKHDRICGILVQSGGGSILAIISVYMPARGSRDNLYIALEELEGILESLEDGVIPIVCGDFNGDIGAEGGSRGLRAPTKAGRLVLKFMHRQHLVAINQKGLTTGDAYTFECHNVRSTLDYIMIPEHMQGCIKRCSIGGYEAINTSDHLPVSAVLDIKLLPRITFNVKGKDKIRWDKWDEQKLV